MHTTSNLEGSPAEEAEQRRARARAYYALHREAVAVQHAAYYAKNAAKVIARQQGYQRWRYANDPAWRAKEVERQRVIRARRRGAAATGVAA